MPVMTVNPSYLIPRLMPLVTLLVVFWICSRTVSGARDAPISFSTPLLDIVSISHSKDAQMFELESDDTVSLLARDLSPDVLATAVPVASLTQKTEAQLHLENSKLHLRSSSRNVNGIAGYKIYSLPILASELTGLLDDTRTDLQNHDTNSKTPFYQFNTQKWSFSVITANISLHYIYIQAVVSRFVKLSSTSSSPTDITSTPVGVVLNGSTPIADVIIMPRPNATNHSHVPFSSFGVHGNTSSADEPIEIATITPFGSSCSYQIINETAALAPFSSPSNQPSTLQPRFLEPAALAHVAQTVFTITIRLWRREDGIPVETKAWVAMAVIALGSVQLQLNALRAVFLEHYRGDPDLDPIIDGMCRIDTGFFDVGRLTTRFVMEIVRRNNNGQLLVLTLRSWLRIMSAMLAPLLRMKVQANTWAMEGEIYGPEYGDRDGGGGRNSSQVILGRWELYFGDKDDL